MEKDLVSSFENDGTTGSAAAPRTKSGPRRFHNVPKYFIEPDTGRTWHVVTDETGGEPLGKGGFSEVYTLRDKETGDEMAGKLTQKSELKTNYDKSRVQKEVNIHASLSHEHIVKFYKHFEDYDFHIFLIQLCMQATLRDLGVLGRRETAHYLLGVAKALGNYRRFPDG